MIWLSAVPSGRDGFCPEERVFYACYLSFFLGESPEQKGFPPDRPLRVVSVTSFDVIVISADLHAEFHAERVHAMVQAKLRPSLFRAYV